KGFTAKSAKERRKESKGGPLAGHGVVRGFENKADSSRFRCARRRNDKNSKVSHLALEQLDLSTYRISESVRWAECPQILCDGCETSSCEVILSRFGGVRL